MSDKQQIISDRSAPDAEIPAWPTPSDYPWPTPLSARPSLVKHFLAPMLGLAIVATTLVGVLASRPDEPYSLSGLLLTLAMASLFCGLGYWRASQLMRKNEPLLELSGRGLSLPGLLSGTVPWSEVSEVVYVKGFLPGAKAGAPGISLTIRGSGRFGPKGRKVPLGTDASASPPDHVPLPGRLDVSPSRLYRAIQTHRAHFGRGGHALPGEEPAQAEAA